MERAGEKKSHTLVAISHAHTSHDLTGTQISHNSTMNYGLGGLLIASQDWKETPKALVSKANIGQR